jgi:hypothetical protein
VDAHTAKLAQIDEALTPTSAAQAEQPQDVKSAGRKTKVSASV